jgi:GAF domain-containing protein/HAMP domain-containing protein
MLSDSPRVKSARRPASIQVQLFLGFGLILALALAIAVIGYVSLRSLQWGTQATIEQAEHIRRLSLGIDRDFLSARQSEARFLNSWRSIGPQAASERYMTEVHALLAQARTKLDDLDALLVAAGDGQLRSLVEQTAALRPLLDTYETAFHSMVTDILRRADPNMGLDRVLKDSLDRLEADVSPLPKPDLHLLILRLRANEQAYFGAGRQEYYDNVRLAVDKFVNLVRASRPADLSTEFTRLTPSNLIDRAQAYLQTFSELVALEQRVQVFTTIFQEVSSDINLITERLNAEGESGLDRARVRMRALGNQITVALAASASLALGLALVVSGALARRIVGPLADLSRAALQIGRGNLDVRLPASKIREIADLSETMEQVAGQLRALIGSLEARVAARTEQLRASADVSRAAVSVLDPDRLLHDVVNLITNRFGFYYAAVFLIDENGRYAVLRDATGEAGRILKERGHKLEVGGQSMVGFATAQRRPRIALDVGEEAMRFANPLLPETRSEIALPLVVGDRALGALDVQSTQEAAFDEASAAVLQGMADQIAIALNNAALYAESQRNVNTMNELLAVSSDIARSRTLPELAGLALSRVHALVGVDSYYLGLVNENQTELRLVVHVLGGVDVSDMMAALPLRSPRLNSLQGAGGTESAERGATPDPSGRPPTLRGEGGWLVAGGLNEHVIRTRKPLRISASEAAARAAESGIHDRAGPRLPLSRASASAGVEEAQPGAFLVAPLVVGERVLGVIGFQDMRPGSFFSDDQERLAITLARQIAVALDNLRLSEETRQALADLDAANRLLTGQAWRARAGGSLSGEWRAGEWLSPSTGSPLPLSSLGVGDFAGQALSATEGAQAQVSHGAQGSADGTPGRPPARRADPRAEGARAGGRLTIPLRIRGEAVGEFDLLPHGDGDQWTLEEVTFAQSLVDQVGQTLETARLLEETERLAGRERRINEINARVRQTVNIDGILQTAVDELGRSMKAARVVARIGVPDSSSDSSPPSVGDPDTDLEREVSDPEQREGEWGREGEGEGASHA